MAKREQDGKTTGKRKRAVIQRARARRTSEQIEDDLVAAARRKHALGEKPSGQELAALKRREKYEEDALRWEIYRSIPQADWREMAGGIHRQQLKDQAHTYGLPIYERKIDLPAVVLALHQFLARNAKVLAYAKRDEQPAGEAPADEPGGLEAKRREEALIARHKRLELEGKLLEREQVHEALNRIANVIRGAGEMLQRRYGVEAQDILDEALEDAEREISKFNGHTGADTHQ